MVPLNLKCLDCILTLHTNILGVLCIQLSNIESLACHVLIMLDFHWSQRENVAHSFWGIFFFIVMWELSWLCQKSVDVISLASALNQGWGKTQNKNICHRIQDLYLNASFSHWPQALFVCRKKFTPTTLSYCDVYFSIKILYQQIKSCSLLSCPFQSPRN